MQPDRVFRFRREMVSGDQCLCCHRRTPAVKVFVSRMDHPDGPVSGAITALTETDLHRLVIDAGEFLGLEVRRRWQ